MSDEIQFQRHRRGPPYLRDGIQVPPYTQRARRLGAHRRVGCLGGIFRIGDLDNISWVFQALTGASARAWRHSRKRGQRGAVRPTGRETVLPTAAARLFKGQCIMPDPIQDSDASFEDKVVRLYILLCRQLILQCTLANDDVYRSYSSGSFLLPCVSRVLPSRPFFCKLLFQRPTYVRQVSWVTQRGSPLSNSLRT